MQYKGKEIIEANGADYPLTNTPHKMLVWNEYGYSEPKCYEKNVLGYWGRHWYAISNINKDSLFAYDHAAEIPTDIETRLTNRELCEWCAKGNGEWCYGEDSKNSVCSNYTYYQREKDKPCYENIIIRKWSDTEWHEPTKEYIGEDA